MNGSVGRPHTKASFPPAGAVKELKVNQCVSVVALSLG